MYRRSGLFVLVLGVLAVYLLAFVPFEQEVRRYTRDENGERVRATASCPHAWDMQYGSGEAEVKYLSDLEYCEKGARLRLTIAAFVGGVALMLGIRGLVRGPRPEPIHLTPLSELFEELRPRKRTGAPP